MENLEKIIERRRNIGLKVKNCNFSLEEIKIVGHLKSRTGILTEISETSFVANGPMASTRKDLPPLLGIASDYRSFASGVDGIAVPIVFREVYHDMGHVCHRAGAKNRPHWDGVQWKRTGCNYQIVWAPPRSHLQRPRFFLEGNRHTLSSMLPSGRSGRVSPEPRR